MQIVQVPSVPLVKVVFMHLDRPFYTEWDFWVSVFTLVLAVGTLWLAFETRGMRKSADQGMRVMETHAAISARAAEVSAQATRAMAEIGQRPWISLKWLRVLSEITPLTPVVRLGLTFLNSGVTPAQHLLANVYSLVTADPFPDAPAYIRAPGVEPFSVTIPPKEEKRVFTDITLDRSDALSIINQQKRLYVYGVATYDDAFGNSHPTKWCCIYHGGINDTSNFMIADKHNSIE